MKRSILFFFLSGILLQATPVNVTFLNAGSPTVTRGDVFVGPYTLSINGVATPAMCMDDYLEVYYGDKWTANVTNAASSNLSNTYLGSGSRSVNGLQLSSSDVYRAEAYLFSLITKSGADRSDIQEAAWAIMDSNTLKQINKNNDKAVQTYITAATQNYRTFDASGYSIISQTGTLSSSSKQEFMVASTPEPATFALFGGGLLLAGAARFFRRRKSA